MNFRFIAAAVALTLLASCQTGIVHRCSSSAECGADAECIEGFCTLLGQDGGGGSGGSGGAGGGGNPLCASVVCSSSSTECRQGTCVLKFSALKWHWPDAGIFTNATNLPLVAELTASGSVSSWPTAVEFSAVMPDGGAVNGLLTASSPGVFTGSLPLPAEGAWSVRAAYSDAGLTTDVRPFTADRTPPTVELFLEAAPVRTDEGDLLRNDFRDTALVRSYRRDEFARAAIRTSASDVDLAAAKLLLSGVRPDGGIGAWPAPQTPSLCPSDISCSLPNCACFTLDLFQPVMDSVHAKFPLRVEVRDRAGNAASALRWFDGGVAIDPGVPVTRFQWVRTKYAKFKSPVAVGSGGNLYLTGEYFPLVLLTATLPDGTNLYMKLITSASTAPVVARDNASGTEAVVINHAWVGGDGGLTAYRASNGAPLFECGGESALGVSSPPVQTTPGALAFAGWARRNAPGLGDATALMLMNVSTTPGASTCSSPVAYGTQTMFANLSASGTTLFSSQRAQGIERHNATTGAPLSPFSGPALSAPVWHALMANDAGTHVAALLSPNQMTFLRNAVDPVWTSAAGALSSESAPIVVDKNLLIFGGPDLAGDPTLTAVRVGADSGFSVPLPKRIAGYPLAGADGRIYASDELGDIYCFRLENDALVFEWAYFVAHPSAGSPNIDCNRAHPGRGSILYWGDEDADLFSIIVDSPGLDIRAPWPKYQHDPRNSGNADTALSEFACP